MNSFNGKSDEQRFLDKLLAKDPLLPGLIASLMRRCDDCDCLEQIGNSSTGLADMFEHRAEFLQQSFQKSLNSILNNPNVLAHIALDNHELVKTQHYIKEMEQAFEPEIVRFCAPESTANN